MADKPQNGLLRRELSGQQVGPIVVAPSADWVTVPGGTAGATEATLVQVRDFLDTVEAKLQSLIDATPALTLTARLLDKRPQSGYRMWLDPSATTNLGAGVILAEAPSAAVEADTTFQGVFIPTAAGRWTERQSFAWSGRGSGW